MRISASAFATLNPPQLDGAVRYFSIAVALRPEAVNSRTSLGEVLAMQDKLDESIAWLNTAIELNPKDASANDNLAAALARERKPDEAALPYAEAVSFTVEDAVAARRDAVSRMPDDYIAHFDLGDGAEAATVS